MKTSYVCEIKETIGSKFPNRYQKLTLRFVRGDISASLRTKRNGPNGLMSSSKMSSKSKKRTGTKFNTKFWKSTRIKMLFIL